MKIEIWHNPRCRKSREGLRFLEEKGLDFDIRNYLENSPSAEELRTVLKKMELTPRDIIRKQEKEYKDLGLKDLALSDSDLIEAMSNNPKLIERPIVINGERAVMGRPVENLEHFFG